MLPEESPFPKGWLSIELPGYRPRGRMMYTLYSYDELPPLPTELLRGDFSWLLNEPLYKPPPPKDPLPREYYEDDPELADLVALGAYELWKRRAPTAIAELTESINQRGMDLPIDFRRFMEDPELVYRIRGVGCQFVFQGEGQLCPAGTRGCLIPFLCDEEDIFTWYLYIDDKCRHCVVGKPTRFDENTCEGDKELDRILRAWWFVAPSFEAFLFRYWIENAIWISLTVENVPLTPMQVKYVRHYNAD